MLDLITRKAFGGVDVALSLRQNFVLRKLKTCAGRPDMRVLVSAAVLPTTFSTHMS